jgi:hypothetical protein
MHKPLGPAKILTQKSHYPAHPLKPIPAKIIPTPKVNHQQPALLKATQLTLALNLIGAILTKAKILQKDHHLKGNENQRALRTQ